MGDSDKETTTIPRKYRTYYLAKAELDALTNLLDGELAWGTDTNTLYRQNGNGAANWVTVTPPNVGGDGHINIFPLNYDSIGQGTWVYGALCTRHLGGRFYNNGVVADGDNLTYKVFLQKGTYTLRIVNTTTGQCAIADYDIDGVEVASRDWYSVGDTPEVIYTETGIVIATSSLKDFRVRLDGRNVAADSWKIFIQGMSFWRTA